MQSGLGLRGALVRGTFVIGLYRAGSVEGWDVRGVPSKRIVGCQGWGVGSWLRLENVRPLPRLIDLRRTSRVRATGLGLGALWGSFPISGFPEIHKSFWLVGPFLVACWATWETARCLQKRWSMLHAAVLLMVYVDLMIVMMIAFFLLAPYSAELL